MSKSLKVNKLSGCARCGQEHTGLMFKRMDRPIVDVLDSNESARVKVSWDYWTLCPESGDPILLRQTDKKKPVSAPAPKKK